MRLLLDTHIAVWWFTGDRRVRVAAQIIEAAEQVPWVSSASLWEVVLKSVAGKLDIASADFAADVEEHGFEWLPIRNDHILRLESLGPPNHHKDPFDRMLIAQAMVEGATLLTVDRNLEPYGPVVRVL